jgi:hypothetical protein
MRNEEEIIALFLIILALLGILSFLKGGLEEFLMTMINLAGFMLSFTVCVFKNELFIVCLGVSAILLYVGLIKYSLLLLSFVIGVGGGLFLFMIASILDDP